MSAKFQGEGNFNSQKVLAETANSTVSAPVAKSKLQSTPEMGNWKYSATNIINENFIYFFLIKQEAL